MITLTIIKREKNKKTGLVAVKRKLVLFKSMDKARKEIIPIVKEMKIAKRNRTEPPVEIVAVSYDTSSERALLLETRALVSVDNESQE